MSGRTFVVIFFFWAALTIITPTLVLWSESSKPNLELNGQKSEGIKDRKMIGYGVKQVSNETISSTQLEAAATTEHQNWSWLQEFESCVNCQQSISKSNGTVDQDQLNSMINLPRSVGLQSHLFPDT